jgi:ribonuclease P protein component
LEEASRHEAVVSSAQQAAPEQAWVSRPHGDALGPGGAVTPAQEGPEAVDGAAAIETRRSLTAGERLRRAARLARVADLRRCLAEGRRHRTQHLDMIWLDNATGHPRIGLIVPKFQSTAVARNRLRRQLREIWRRELQATLPPGDLVVRARREAYQAGYLALRAEMTEWRKRVNGSTA